MSERCRNEVAVVDTFSRLSSIAARAGLSGVQLLDLVRDRGADELPHPMAVPTVRTLHTGHIGTGTPSGEGGSSLTAHTSAKSFG